MPAGASFKVAINEPYDAKRRYFGYVEPSAERGNAKYVNMQGFIEGDHVGSVQIPDDDPLVKANRVDPDATLLTLQVPDWSEDFGRQLTSMSGAVTEGASDPGPC